MKKKKKLFIMICIYVYVTVCHENVCSLLGDTIKRGRVNKGFFSVEGIMVHSEADDY